MLVPGQTSPLHIPQRTRGVRTYSVQVVPEDANGLGLTQFADSPRFNLTDSFARHLEFFAYFFQCMIAVVQQTETQFDHLTFAEGQLAENLVDLLTQLLLV